MRRKPEAFCTTVLIVINVAVFLILSMLGDTEDAKFLCFSMGRCVNRLLQKDRNIIEYLRVCFFILELHI